jgi:hypothetical protein
MTTRPRLSSRAALLAVAIVLLFVAAAQAQAQPPLVLQPKVVENNGATITFTVTSNGAFDLSGITVRQIRFSLPFEEEFSFVPDEFAFDRVTNVTRRGFTLVARITDRSVIGERRMNITFGDMIVLLRFRVDPPFVCPPSCRPPNMCVNKICVLPPTKCNPRCRPPALCNPETRKCEVPR